MKQKKVLDDRRFIGGRSQRFKLCVLYEGDKKSNLVNNFSPKPTIEGVAKIYLVFLTPDTNYVLQDMDQRVRDLGTYGLQSLGTCYLN